MAENDGKRTIDVSDTAAEAARARREALHGAVMDLERILDDLSAGPGTPDDDVQLRAALENMQATLRQHIAESEADDGLLAEIVKEAPWFAPRTEALRREHGELLAFADELVEQAHDPEAAGPTIDEARDLAARVSEHRHRGTALLMDAYTLDVSAGD